jgi:hypothetical protein
MFMTRSFAILLLVLAVYGCGRKNPLDVDISGIKCSPVKIRRYDLDLFSLNTDDLGRSVKQFQGRYNVFLGDSLDDPSKLSILREYLIDPRNQDFYKAVKARYTDLSEIENGLTLAFKHFIYYMPSFRVPGVYAYISGGDYEYPVQFADSVMVIGLDNYLGKNYSPYLADGVSRYNLERMDEEHIVTDCARLLANSTFPIPSGGNSLLDIMVEAGKRLYILDAMMPGTPDRLKIGYTQAQYDWIMKNEGHVWAAIIENRMLYSNDGRVVRVFTTDGPFTAEFTKESPPLLGSWIGWQIVRKYMERNTETSLASLIQEKDAQKILSVSKFKPGK